jgi:hypothetical protein
MNTNNNKGKTFDAAASAAQRDEKEELFNLYPGWRLSETNPLNLPVRGPFALLSEDDNDETSKKSVSLILLRAILFALIL